MYNTDFERCDRFETKFGEGSILYVLTLLQKGETYEHIIEALHRRCGKKISLAQFYRYIAVFTKIQVNASEDVEKYYRRKEFEAYYIQLVEKDKRFIEIARQDNIIFANFLPEEKDDAGKI